MRKSFLMPITARCPVYQVEDLKRRPKGGFKRRINVKEDYAHSYIHHASIIPPPEWTDRANRECSVTIDARLADHQTDDRNLTE